MTTTAIGWTANFIFTTGASSPIQVELRRGPLRWRGTIAIVAMTVSLISSSTELCGGEEAESSSGQAQSKGVTDVYGDPLPLGAIARLGTARYRHPGWNKRIAFLPNGETLVVGAPDSKLCAWNVISGKRTHEVDLGGHSFQAFCLSSDGKQIATLSRQINPGSREFQMRLSIRDTESWREQSQFSWTDSSIESPQQVAFSPDGKTIALGARNGAVRLHDAQSGQEFLREGVLRGDIDSLVFSPSGEILAVAGRQDVVLWKPGKDKPQKIAGLEHGAQVVLFSPDGSRLAVGSGHDKAARIYDVQSLRLLQHLNGKSEDYYREGMCFSADGKQLFIPARTAKSCELFDVDTGRLLRSFDAGGVEPSDAAVSADGRLLACIGSESAVIVWDTQTGERLSDRFVGHLDIPFEIAFTADGRRVVTCGKDGTIRTWDAATGKPVQMLAHSHWVVALALSPRGDRLASCGLDDTVRLWDLAAGKELFHLDGHGRTGGNRSTEVAFSPNGEQFFSFGGDMYMRAYNVRNGRIVAEHRISPTGVTVDQRDDGGARITRDPGGPALPDQALLAADTTLLLMGGLRTGAIYTFDVQTGQELDVFRPDVALQDYAISPDLKLLLTSEQPRRNSPEPNATRPAPKLWIRDFASKQIIREINLSGRYGYQTAFSPDSKFMAILVREDSRNRNGKEWISVLDTETFQQAGQIECFSTRGIAFSHDSTRLATSHEDSTVIVWDLAKLQKHPAASK